MSEPAGWSIVQDEFNPAKQRHSETIFTTGNGYFGTRGVLEEEYPGEERSTFIHGVFDDVPLVFTELANAPDWLELEIILAGEHFNLNTGEIITFRRTLNLKTALLTREVRWISPKGRVTHLRFERFASLSDEHLAGLRVLITPENYSSTVEVRAGLNAECDNLGLKHWEALDQAVQGQQAWLYCQTRSTHIGLAAGLVLSLRGAALARARHWGVRRHPTVVISSLAKAGETMTVQKWVVYTTSRDEKNPLLALKRQLRKAAALEWEAALAAHAQAWETEWSSSDVIIEGDPKAQLAIRFNIYQLLIAAPRHDERVNIGAKTLSGYGYRGHAFWDTEIFILPFFIYTRPEIARNLLSYRWHNLPGARRKAQGNHLRGAQYPWESAGSGDEVTPTWVPYYPDPTKLVRIWTGDIEIHISADITHAIWQYWQATGDDAFMCSRGVEVVLETARFWASRAEWAVELDRYDFKNVIGPDEYHEHVDNNAFTNSMAIWNLRTALRMIDWLVAHHPSAWQQLRRKLTIKPAELKLWQHVADHIYVSYNHETRLIEQFEGYFQRKDIDLARLEPRSQSVQALFGIEETNRTQVNKQPDVLMLLYLLSENYDLETLRVNYNYYTPRTDHTYGSSLGPSIQAIMAARMQDRAAAYEHFWRAAQADLYDVRGNAGDGIHGASAGGLWQAVAFGFAGLRPTPSGWEAHPCLPEHWTRLAFKIMHRGQSITIDIHK